MKHEENYSQIWFKVLTPKSSGRNQLGFVIEWDSDNPSLNFWKLFGLEQFG